MDTNYTTKSQEAISGAMQAAAAAGNPQIEPAHLLVELLSQPDGVAAGLLAAVCPDAAARQDIAHRSLTGAIDAVLTQSELLAVELDSQEAEYAELRRAADRREQTRAEDWAGAQFIRAAMAGAALSGRAA